MILDTLVEIERELGEIAEVLEIDSYYETRDIERIRKLERLVAVEVERIRLGSV